MFQPEEEDSLEDNAYRAAEGKDRGEGPQISREEWSEGNESWDEKDRHEKSMGNHPIFARIDLFQGDC